MYRAQDPHATALYLGNHLELGQRRLGAQRPPGTVSGPGARGPRAPGCRGAAVLGSPDPEGAQEPRTQTAPPREAPAKPIGRRLVRLPHLTPHVMRHVMRPGSPRGYELGLVERERPERAGRVPARRWRRDVHGGGGESAPPGQVPAPFPRGAWW